MMLALQTQEAPTTCEPEPLEQFKLRAWADRVVALSIATAHGEIVKADAVDDLQSIAERDGLVAAFGQDEIQRALAHGFDAIWARPIEAGGAVP